MKPSTTIVAATALLALGGGLFAARAVASPAAPAPAPAATATAVPTGRSVGSTGVGWFYRVLTSEQRDCLADAALQRPDGRLSDDQRARLQDQVRSTLAGCGVEVPQRLADRPRLGFAWARLSPEQQRCLADATPTRPFGRLTDAERAAVRASLSGQLAACGIGR